MQNAREGVRLINGVLEIIRIHFGIEFDETSHQYKRFITHLHFFSGRVTGIDPKGNDYNQDTTLKDLLANLASEAACVEKIADFVKIEFNHPLSEDEKSYLIIHLHNNILILSVTIIKYIWDCNYFLY